MEKNDFRTELNPFEMLEELLWQDQFELIFPENEKQSELRYDSSITRESHSVNVQF